MASDLIWLWPRRVSVSVYRIDRLDMMRFVTVGGFAGTLAARSILSFVPARDSREELLPVPWTATGCAAEYSGDRHVDPSLTQPDTGLHNGGRLFRGRTA